MIRLFLKKGDKFVKYNVAIIGAGLIGKKRAKALCSQKNCTLVAVADINKAAACDLAQEFEGKAYFRWEDVVSRDDIDIVIVSTSNNFLAPVSIAALNSKKHVLCEKPLGRNSNESYKIVQAAEKNKCFLKTGFNHRHHSAIWQAKQLASAGEIGLLHYIRCIYGHGGRPGYEKEWRASKKICGGGEMLDQGVHVVDLFRWFMGDFSFAFGYTPTYVWPMQVEDNAFVLFKDKKGKIGLMQTSWTQWKNRFNFEVYGEKGYLIVNGLGGSYGKETLILGKRNKHAGPPDEKVFEFEGKDISWRLEWEEFIKAIQEKREPLGNGKDGYQALRMIEAAYRSSKSGKVIKI